MSVCVCVCVCERERERERERGREGERESCCDNTLCVFGVFLAFAAVFISPLFTLFVTVHRKTNFLVNLYWDNKHSDSAEALR